MRIVVFLSLSLAALAEAKCMSGYVAVWPKVDQVLPANGQLVVEGVGVYQEAVADIAQRQPVLETAHERVPLEVVGIYRGAMRVVQAVLKPSRALKSGQRYQIRLVAPKADQPLPLVVWGGADEVAMSWKVGDADNIAPRWNSAPEAMGGSNRPLGCGPAIFALAKVSVDDASVVHYLVELLDQKISYLVEADGAKLSIGHDMCSGPFNLVTGTEYRVKLSAIDASGNAAEAPAPLIVVGP